jgi:hypothetical protein
MSSALLSLRQKSRTQIRARVAAVAPQNTSQAQIDKTAESIANALDNFPKANTGNIEHFVQFLTLITLNIEVLGSKCFSVAPEKLLVEDDSQLKALLEQDVEERKITNEFAASEICDKCGLPKSNDKMNINRLDVEDEVFGTQFDAVYNDVCTCMIDEALKNRAGKRKEGESDLEWAARLKKDEEEKKKEAKKDPTWSLWEEQNDLVEQKKNNNDNDDDDKNKVAALPERRQRGEEGKK